jgi:uncharacterized protein (TIGR03435 family)
MKRALCAGVLAGIAAWAAWSQAPSQAPKQTPAARPEFDVASLKPVVLDGADTYMANLGTYRNGVVATTNTTLAECLRFAYAITSDDLLAGPEWIKNKSVRFDILAKTAPDTPRDQALLMLRTLLEDRFKLALRREPRVLSYYALTAPNGVHKMQPARDPPVEGEVTLWQGHFRHNRMTMLMLASLLARSMRLPVVDQTALSGAFEVKLDWARDNSLPAPGAAPAEPADGPSIFEAVQQQLGLKLEKRKGPVDVLVVDHAEKTPLAN